MDLQTIFNTAVMGVMTQGKQAMNAYGTCALRGQEPGCKCAVGWLLPDELYQPFMEDWAQLDLSDAADFFEEPFGEVLATVTGSSEKVFELLKALQDAHDADGANLRSGNMFRPIMSRRFREVAQDFNLNSGVLDAFKEP